MNVKIIGAVLIIAIIVMIFSVCGIVYYKVLCKINELCDCIKKISDILDQNNERIRHIHEDIEEAYKRINRNKERIEVLEKDDLKRERAEGRYIDRMNLKI